MIRGIGVDLIGIARIEEMLENPNFLARFFTPEEQAYVHGRGAAGTQSAAGIYAAKEAMLKALGTGIAPIGLQEVGVTHAASGAPQAALGPKAAARLLELGGERMHISITHAEGMAVAVAIIE
ncbi:MAG: holo-ACP synthase [Clostridia bacterium]|nr:holo-ACP synthase [Clostridia bacterium]